MYRTLYNLIAALLYINTLDHIKCGAITINTSISILRCCIHTVVGNDTFNISNFYNIETMGNGYSLHTKFKQIVVDLNNYKSLKEMGQAGDIFNDVIRKMINKLNSGDISHHQNKEAQ